MTTQYQYRIVEQAAVPASAVSTAKEALALASELQGIGRPKLYWFLAADRPEHKVFNESSRPLAGWTQRSEIFIAADLPDRYVWETVAHEVDHIYTALVGYGTVINRSRNATAEEIAAAHEQHADAFVRLFNFHYPDRRNQKTRKR